MADQKLTDKSSLIEIDDGDLIHIVDISDTTSSPQGTSKKSVWSLLKSTLKTYFDSIYTTTAAVASQITTALSGYLTSATAASTYAPLASPTFSGTVKGVSIPFSCALSDETTEITTETAKITFRVPYACTLTDVRASLTTASSSGIPTFDINENGTSVLSTKLTIDANEKTSTTATTPVVISDSALADDAEITIDVDVPGTGATGAKITMYLTRV